MGERKEGEKEGEGEEEKERRKKGGKKDGELIGLLTVPQLGFEGRNSGSRL